MTAPCLEPAPPPAVASQGASRGAAAPAGPGWLRRQRWWLLAVALLAPAAALAALGLGWWEYLSDEGGPAIRAEAGEEVEYAGATWRLLQWRVLDRDEAEAERVGLPEGAQVVAALIEVAPGPDAPEYCRATLVDPAADRRWRAGWDTVDVPGGRDAASSCDGEAVAPYRLLYTWVVPDDVGASGELELVVADEAPLRIRFLPAVGP